MLLLLISHDDFMYTSLFLSLLSSPQASLHGTHSLTHVHIHVALRLTGYLKNTEHLAGTRDREENKNVKEFSLILLGETHQIFNDKLAF